MGTNTVSNNHFSLPQTCLLSSTSLIILADEKMLSASFEKNKWKLLLRLVHELPSLVEFMFFFFCCVSTLLSNNAVTLRINALLRKAIVMDELKGNAFMHFGLFSLSFFFYLARDVNRSKSISWKKCGSRRRIMERTFRLGAFFSVHFEKKESGRNE